METENIEISDEEIIINSTESIHTHEIIKIESIEAIARDDENFTDRKLETKTVDKSKVPYILNGELYEILARNGENVTVKCCYCPAGRFYRGSVRSTGNFHMHIKRIHPNLLGKLHDMKVRSLLERRDRLMKNRKARTRCASGGNNGNKDEQEVHKLKIKRAFQRHQAEAKTNDADTITVITENPNQTLNCCTKLSECNCKSVSPETDQDAVLNNELTTTNSFVLATENVYGDVCMYNVQPITSSSNLNASQSPPRSVTVVTPFPSSYESSTFGKNTPTLSGTQFLNDHNIVEHPLDLSLNTSTPRTYSPTSSHVYESSGIGLGPMCSFTTVANTVSTAISAIDNGNRHMPSISRNDHIWLQQRLAATLSDIHNDIRTRNRIEHNRLLLEIAKLKFLHPGFYFNLQE